MFNKLVLFALSVVIFLSACGGDLTTTDDTDVRPDGVSVSFKPLCDIVRHVGMYTYATEKTEVGSISPLSGYGFSVRMTEAEYEKECSKYE